MTRVNLIPAGRRHAMRTRLHLRWWITACTGYAMFLGVASLVAHVVGANDDRSLRTELGRVETRLETARGELGQLRGQLRETATMIRASRAVGAQPDWSVLLALVAETTGEDVALRDFRIGSRRSGGTGRLTTPVVTAGSSEAPVVLGIGGIGRSQHAVSSFVLQVQQLPLFRQVKLLDTVREPFFDDHAIAFHLECMLDADEGSAP